MNSKYFATLASQDDVYQHNFPVRHTAATMSGNPLWASSGSLKAWDVLQSEEATHEGMMNRYLEFGEVCAAHNLVPSFRLFEHWKDSEAIATVAKDSDTLEGWQRN